MIIIIIINLTLELRVINLILVPLTLPNFPFHFKFVIIFKLNKTFYYRRLNRLLCLNGRLQLIFFLSPHLYKVQNL